MGHAEMWPTFLYQRRLFQRQARNLKSFSLRVPTSLLRPIRPHLCHTREEEYKAYGQTFVGSGQQDDYDAMTELHEGTFGHVVFSSTCA
jgi:hypothetical protein